MHSNRRTALQTLGVGLASATAATVLSSETTIAATSGKRDLLPEGASHLGELMARLDKVRGRRDFKTVPMILTTPNEWDDKAIKELLAYRPAPKQAWDNTKIDGAWLNLMRNSLNAQIWSFKHPNFLAVSVTHGSANLALYDEHIWDKYQITNLAGDKFKTNTLIIETKAGSADPKSFEDPEGVYSPHDNSIPALMRRGVVFMACHNAIWEQSSKLLARGLNPDKLSVEQIAAELTNHLLPGVVLTPGAVATMPELQMSGFYYAK